MDPRCSPKRIRDAHLSNELPNLQLCLWPATLRSRFPPPIPSKPSAVPTDNGFWSNNYQGAQHTRGQAMQPGKEQAVDAAEGRPLR